MPQGRYADLLKSSGFLFFLWTQFLGAFNDNVYKIVVAMFAVDTNILSHQGSGFLTLAGAVFILPFLLFSGYAGYLADSFNKRTVLIVTKSTEMIATGVGLWVLLSGKIAWMLGGLFLMALHSTFFSPAKYGILPEMLPSRDLSRANGLLEMSTFLAIILGSSLGTVLFATAKNEPHFIGLVLIGISLIGTISSFGISKVPSPSIKPLFRLTPWTEIHWGVKRLYLQKLLWITVISISFFWFLGALLQMDILLFGKEIMHLDDLRIGILTTILAVGIGTGSLAAGRLSGDKIELGLVPPGLIGMALFSLLLSISGFSYVQTSAMLVLLGFSGGLFIVPLNAFLQQRSEKAEKGRLIATNNFLNMFGVLLASGTLWILRDYFRIPANQIILIFGILMMGGVFFLKKVISPVWIPEK